MLTRACYGVGALAAFDVLEDVLQGVVVGACVQDTPAGICESRVFTVALYLVSTMKFALFATVVLAIVFGALAVVSLRRDRARGVGQLLLRLRAPVAIALVLVVGYLVHATPFADQAADLLRRWQDDRGQAIFATGLTIVLAVVLVAAARSLADISRSPEDGLADPSRLWIATAVLTTIGLAAWQIWPGGPGLLVPAGFCGVVALLGTLTNAVEDDPPPPVTNAFGSLALPATVGAVPLVALGLAVQGAATTEVAWAGHSEYVVWIFVGLAIQLVGWAAFRVFRRPAANGGRPAVNVERRAAFGTVVVVVVAVWTWIDPWSIASTVGGAGVLATFAIAATLVTWGLCAVAERYRPPSALRLLGFRRTPFLLLLLAWGIIAASIDRGGFHDARLVGEADTPAQARAGVTVKVLFDRWRKARGLPDAPQAGSPSPPRSSQATPLILVAASGGGIRAAFWTAETLDCVFGESESDDACAGGPRSTAPVIAASGVSGGSLGLTSWRTHTQTPQTSDWIDTLATDALTPTLAWGLLVDLPNSLLHTERIPDRAEILERSWEREWRGDAAGALGKGLFETGAEAPLLMLNGTSVESGCRLNVSVLDASIDDRSDAARDGDCVAGRVDDPAAIRERWALGASADVSKFVCRGQDLRLSTAALLSARFPYVSPSGRLPACGSDDLVTYAVDGGYFDGSAADSAAELWTALAPFVERYNAATGECVVPFAIQIDNAYDDPPGPGRRKRPLESVAPLQTVLGVRGAREADARQMLELATGKPLGDITRVEVGDPKLHREAGRYAHIYPRAHPGTQAPLGWALSDATQEDLRDQLHENAGVIRDIRNHWLSPGKLRCARAEVPTPRDRTP